MLVVLTLTFAAACAAPALPGSSLPSSDSVPIASTEIPLPDFSGHTLEPLIRVGEDGRFQPGLAESWTITSTDDGESVQVEMVLSSDWLDDNGQGRIEDIQNIVEQINNYQCDSDDDSCAIVPGGNPCIYPTPTATPPPSGPQPFMAIPVLPGSENETTITMLFPTEACEVTDDECQTRILESIARIPIADPDTFTFYAPTNTGHYIFEYSSVDGSSGMLEYDPETGDIVDICPECKPTQPPILPMCTPTASEE
jgi:hypothetical protein